MDSDDSQADTGVVATVKRLGNTACWMVGLLGVGFLLAVGVIEIGLRWVSSVYATNESGRSTAVFVVAEAGWLLFCAFMFASVFLLWRRARKEWRLSPTAGLLVGSLAVVYTIAAVLFAVTGYFFGPEGVMSRM